MVFPIGGAGPEAFLISVVHCPAEHVRAIFVHFAIRAAAIVAIDRGTVKIGIVIVVVAFGSKTLTLPTLALIIFLLKAILRHPVLLLQRGGPLLGKAFLLFKTLLILIHPLLLLPDQLLLAFL